MAKVVDWPTGLPPLLIWEILDPPLNCVIMNYKVGSSSKDYLRNTCAIYILFTLFSKTKPSGEPSYTLALWYVMQRYCNVQSLDSNSKAYITENAKKWHFGNGEYALLVHQIWIFFMKSVYGVA